MSYQGFEGAREEPETLIVGFHLQATNKIMLNGDTLIHCSGPPKIPLAANILNTNSILFETFHGKRKKCYIRPQLLPVSSPQSRHLERKKAV